MKKLLLILLCLPMIGFGQLSIPHGINYQAVVRDSLGIEISNQSIDIRFTAQVFVPIPNYMAYNIWFQETHSITTNDFGLFSVVLGQGTPTSSYYYNNNIGNIDWSILGLEFKVEIDYGNGYVEMFDGAPPFMSVPYSFKSIRAESAITADNVNSYDELQTLSISGDTIFISQNPYYGTAGNYITLPAPTSLQSKVDSLELVIDSIVNSSVTYSVGDIAQGGIVFYVSPDGKNGLVAATIDQSTSSNWYNASDVISNPSNHTIEGQKFRDWRLPTKHELNEMYLYIGQGNALGLGNIGGFVQYGFYWSSTEDGSSGAGLLLLWGQDFSNGIQYGKAKHYDYYVRAVRAF